MKRILSIFAVILFTASMFSQSPEQMSYQAVIRNGSDQLVTGQAIGIQISILQGSVDGTTVYVETQNLSTNANGLATLEIGAGTTSDDFSSIDWSNGPYFIKTETDPTTAGGTNYTITGTSQFLSVPYALYAKNAGNFTETDPVFEAWNKDYRELTNKPGIIDTLNEVLDTTTQFLRAEVDGDTTNEIQNLTYSGNSLSIDNGNSVIINESKWNSAGDNIYQTSGLVGIGTDSPTASIEVYDNVGYPFLKFVSEDNVYTYWISDRIDVDDYHIGIDGGNNKFSFANLTTGDYPLTLHGDKVGIGTLDPEASLHINDFMKLEPRTSAPSSPTKGMIYYDDTDNKVKVYTGSVWESLN